MAGDGINDAPRSPKRRRHRDGHGTDVAMESAGRTLVKGDLRGIVRARRLSRATMRNIRQNLFFAFIYNRSEFRSRPGAVSRFRPAAQPDDRERGDDVQLGFRDWQCTAVEARIAVNAVHSCLRRRRARLNQTSQCGHRPVRPGPRLSP